MNPGNGHATGYGFLDRFALLFGAGRIERALAERPSAGKNGVEGKGTVGVLPLEAPAKQLCTCGHEVSEHTQTDPGFCLECECADFTPVLPLEAPAQITPTSYTEPALNMDLAEVLSPSQANAYLDCSAKWFFKYFRNLPDVKDAKRALGLAIHKAIEHNFRSKLDTKKDLEREALLEVYAASWKAEAEDARFAEDDDRAELERTGAVLVQKYLVEAAPEIIPIAVEHQVSGEIAGVKVRGYIDLMDSNGRIIDVKTASKKPSEIMPDYARQVATYTQLMPGASGKIAIHTLVQTRGRDGRPTSTPPQLIEQNHTVNDADIRHTQIIYPLVQEAMRSGLYTPNRNSMFCSRKSCAFWQACQEEFGGEVAEK